MERMLKEKYDKVALPQFTETLREECYNSIEKFCENAKKQASKLNNLELQQSTSQYTSLCDKLITEIEQFVAERKEKYIPYIMQLSEKVTTQHDCAGCSGNCKLNHDMALLELRTSHTGIKNILYRLQMVTLPLYSETIYPDAYRVLRNQMALIESNLTELYFIEENFLIPKITEAQKNINAGGN